MADNTCWAQPYQAMTHQEKVSATESRLAALAGREHALLAPRATTALVAILRALDLPPGSEVLMPATLCANPAYAVRWAGLRPLFADISPATFNLDLGSAEKMVGPDTRVVLAVPLFGHPLDVPALLAFAERHQLIVVEDAAQAVGLSHADRPAGSVGLCSVYSFGPGKIADAGGGAALLSDDSALLTRAREYLSSLPSAARDPTEQAARILAALDALPAELQGRAEQVLHCREVLDLSGVTHPHLPPGRTLWKYSVLLPGREERDRMTRDLLARGVQATNLYPPLTHFFPEARGSASENYPVAWNVFNRVVNLPLWPPSAAGSEDRSSLARGSGECV